MTTYRLLHERSAPLAPPTLDPFQQSVVDHPGGPLLVLAGPGTGKTTTIVEAIVDRIERRGASPDSVLALTFKSGDPSVLAGLGPRMIGLGRKRD